MDTIQTILQERLFYRERETGLVAGYRATVAGLGEQTDPENALDHFTGRSQLALWTGSSHTSITVHLKHGTHPVD